VGHGGRSVGRRGARSLPSRGLSCAGGVLSARRSSVSEFQLFSDRSTVPHASLLSPPRDRIVCAVPPSSPRLGNSLRGRWAKRSSRDLLFKRGSEWGPSGLKNPYLAH
jgi:hypothetical protein